MSLQPTTTLLSIDIDNGKVISSGGNNIEKSVKSDFIKAVYRIEEFSFLTFDTR